MDSDVKTQLLRYLVTFMIVYVTFSVTHSQKFDSLTQRVSFYSASLLTKPLTFYDDTKLVNIHTILNFTQFGRRFSMSNNSSCSQNVGRFFDYLFLTVRRFQKVARWLLSLPGFSVLVECDTFLPKYFQFMVGHASKMSCPRAYRSSVLECKTWALRSCVGFSVEERQWSMDKKRLPRSNWMFHAGVFGLFRAIYKSTGHKCKPNHVENLKGTLKVLARGLAISQLLTRVVNGKVVYLFKVTDQMNSKLDVLAQDLKIVDSTFSFWQKQLKKFVKSVRCHEDLTIVSF